MARHAVLNNTEHRNLRISTRHSAAFGEQVHAVPTFPTEYADVMREYPIFFRKVPETGEYQSVALLGFEKGENLFLEGEEWRGNYVPGILARGPFMIAFQEQETNGERRRDPVISIDLDDPRVSETDGERVFLDDGSNSPFLDRVSGILSGIQRGLAVEKAMFAALDRHGLVVATEVKVGVRKDRQVVLQGLYTISQKKFSALDGEALAELNKAGYLQAAVLVMHSLGNVGRMTQIKSRRMAESPTENTADAPAAEAPN